MKKKKIVLIVVIFIIVLYCLSYIGAMGICYNQGLRGVEHHFPYPKCYGDV